MVYLSELQKETLLLVDEMINKEMKHNDIVWKLQELGYYFMVEVKNGYASKTKMKLYKKNENGKEEYSFVDLIKRRNGLAYWETIKLS